ncbi:MAG TPA: LLM class flavin-dependent oxidoreductase [Candidatus Binataceae bacterium]|nr:LLM class flavin-dependent oxidoreductase [Candidatus Binataceae bacterium]
MAACGISISTFSGIAYRDFVNLAREAEDAGYTGVFVPEANNDALICCHAIAKETRRIQIGTWIVNIYLREPTLCAAAAEMVQDESDGRFILGLGVSHRPALEARGIDMGNARDRLRRDTDIIRKTLSGENAMFGMKFRQPKKPLPIYYAALALETSRLGGELADGLMLYLCTPERARRSAEVARETAQKHGRKPSAVAITVGVPVFLHQDLKRAYAAAKRGLAFYGALPFYNRLLARSGFEGPAAKIMEAAQRHDADGMAAALSEQMIDALALVGPESRCRERLEQYRAAGAELPILVPNAVEEDYSAGVRRVLKTFAN